MEKRLVSIIMPVYNGEKFIRKAIESALAQTYKNWQLIVVDDGSTDNTAQVVSTIKDKRVLYIYQKNRGEASARNTALKNVQGEYIAFLDSDDMYLPSHLEYAIEHLSKNNRLSGVYSDGYHIDHAENRLQTLSSRRRGPFEGNLFEAVVCGPDVFGPPVCVVLRTNLINENGLVFDENIVIGPDWDFFTKYADLGEFGYVDQKTCLYRLHISNISITTGLERRALELAKCRINAVKMESFSKCSIQIQTQVFYDLLCNLLIGYPERQSELSQLPVFNSLPKKEQSRLFRLMAGTTLTYVIIAPVFLKDWLYKSWYLHPIDPRSMFMLVLLIVFPGLLIKILKMKNRHQMLQREIIPFNDMKLNGNS